jgi:predicted metal-binding protein
MNKPPLRVTRAQILACNWSWAALGKAKAYKHAIELLRCAGCDNDILKTAFKKMMRVHAKDTVRLARCYTPRNFTP